MASASQRFAADTEEAPSFRKHVIPLVGRLGCNGRACHGSFQGQGGFRLSLFGYDFEADLAAMMAGDEPRTNREKPEQSLILKKPTMQVDHGGEERMKKGSWQYKVLLKWIQEGAKGVADTDPDFVSLDVAPQELVFKKTGETAQLRAVVTWSDGSREDVTALCRFTTNDETVAKIDANGLVTCTGKGDTHVVSFYDNGVSPIPVMLPVTDLTGPKYPAIAGRTKVDHLVLQKLRKIGVVPSEVCGDEEFLRRVSLDLTGTLPTAGEIEAFLADKSPDKRAKKVEELFTRPGYAAWWTTRLCDWTGASPNNVGENQFRNEVYQQWYRWIHKRVADNAPYDKLVEGIVLAVGRSNSEQTFREYCEEMSSYFRTDEPANFADRQTMPHFWNRRQQNMPKDKALQFTYAFLGVRLQCAECHKHPFDQWTKQDFDQFTAFFNNIRYGTKRDDNEAFQEMTKELLGEANMRGGQAQQQMAKMIREGKTAPWRELYVETRAAQPQRRRPGNNAPQGGRVLTPKLLGGDEVVAQEYPDPRVALMEWMTHDDNPYFARAIVNRVWANYFNVGIIEPPDDMNLANPPSNAALLDYLAGEFVKNGYDLKWLHREIIASDAYQRSWKPNETNRLDLRNFSRAVPRRLPAEIAYDALVQATGNSDRAHSWLESIDGRAISETLAGRGQGRQANNYVMAVFGRPERASQCDCERSNEPSLLQTVYLRNDDEVLTMLDRRDGWLAEVKNSKDADDDLIRQAYLRTLSRLPDDNEMEIARSHVTQSQGRDAGLRDLVWALINTKEFIVNH
ncbi:MAG: DUF1553 domain-containing protein [Planctomycetia bacterium]|nr:DUF1553 domain-containing protein [Planctomycetia bacterium]